MRSITRFTTFCAFVAVLVNQSKAACSPSCNSNQICGADSVCYASYINDTKTVTINGVDYTAQLNDGQTTGASYAISALGTVNFRYEFTTGSRFIQHCRISVQNADFIVCTITDLSGNTLGSCSKLNSKTMSTTTGSNLELFAGGVKGTIYSDSSQNIYEITCYGLESTDSPTDQPTTTPTMSTGAPSTPPTQMPTRAPSPQPTNFPTANVCSMRSVTQPCCGAKGYSVLQERNNTRQGKGDNCTFTDMLNCCGDDLSDVQGTQGNLYCSPGVGTSVCNATYFNEKNSVYPYMAIDGSFISSVIGGGGLEACNCTFTFYSCEGEDRAQCGAPDDYAWLKSELGNGTNWYNVSSWFNDSAITTQLTALNVTAEDREFYEWDACSTDSFYGDVSDIYSANAIDIDDGVCKCQYDIEVCGALPDDETIFYDSCLEENITQCCEGGDLEFVYDDDSRSVVSIRCASTPETNELCPNVYDGMFGYTVTPFLNWWFDFNMDDYDYQCECRYHVNICGVPTSEPSPTPTGVPSSPPTGSPTEEVFVTTQTTEDNGGAGGGKSDGGVVAGLSGMQIGAAAGILAFALIVGILLFCYCQSRKQNKRAHKEASYAPSAASMKRVQMATGKAMSTSPRGDGPTETHQTHTAPAETSAPAPVVAAPTGAPRMMSAPAAEPSDSYEFE